MNLTSNIAGESGPWPSQENYTIDSFNVPDDFPISITRSGVVLSRFRDLTWDLSPYADQIVRLNFASVRGSGGVAIDNTNILLLKRLTLWILYGWRTKVAIGTIKLLFYACRALASICIDNSTTLNRLEEQPRLFEQLRKKVPNSRWRIQLLVLKRAYLDRKEIGFHLFRPDQLGVPLRKNEFHVSRQTAYIPEKIFFAILSRCQQIIDDFNRNKSAIMGLYETCMNSAELAIKEFGSKVRLGTVSYKRIRGKNVPLNALEHYYQKDLFSLITELGLVEIFHDLTKHNGGKYPLNKVSAYLSNVQLAARILITALTGMRESECGSLTVDCLETRDDAVLGKVFFIKGSTTKTQQDANAYWVTSELGAFAVQVAVSIASIRYSRPALRLEENYSLSKLLFARAQEPWHGGNAIQLAAASNPNASKNAGLRLQHGFHLVIPEVLLKINDTDLLELLSLTPDIDRNRFSTDQPFPIAWHQFRRTFVCQSLGAGVSIVSVMWQMKHAGIAMTQHYGRNYFALPMDPDLKLEFEKTQLEVFTLNREALASADFIVPIKGRKEVLLRTLTISDERKLANAVKQGHLAIKRTAIGVCTNPEPCEYGGWENIASCMGCTRALVARNNHPLLKKMQSIVQADIQSCDVRDTLLKHSLSTQLNAIEEALHAIEGR